ncbi:MAG TPA: CDP-alcohol phosphatidyltransferase family protein [Verrucomicrobiae bacterium]
MEPSRILKFAFVQTLTLVRVPLILLFLGLAVFSSQPPSPRTFWSAFCAMILAALTDLFDGYFARRLRVTSRFGSYADPMVDKVYYLVTLPTLVFVAQRTGQPALARVLLLLTVIFLFRDQWVSFLRSLGAVHGLSAKANWSGKARTLISFPTICVVYFYLQAPASVPLQFPLAVVYALVLISTLINVISMVVYTRAFWPALKAELKHPGGDTK